MNHGIKPKDGPVLVTGASGGVRSIAAMILASMGYRVTASTGRPEEAAWLYKTVGVEEIINRSELASPGKPLQKERGAAAIDTVGSHTLCNACAGVRYGSIVAACGMAQGMDLMGKRLVRTVLIFTESSDQLSRATDRVPGLPASPGYVQ